MARSSLFLLACLGTSSACVVAPYGDHANSDADGGTQSSASLVFTDAGSPLAALGQALFEDTRLSEPAGVSCASCHDSGHAFSGNNESSVGAVSAGSRAGIFGTRNTPTAKYAAMSPDFGFVASEDDDAPPGSPPEYDAQGGQFWDGRASTLEQQAQGPFVNVLEMNNASPAAVVEKLKSAPYRSLWDQVFGADILDTPDLAFERASEAIAAFERTSLFSPFSSKFDDVLRDKDKFTDQEQRGYNLFVDPQKGNCIACHVGDPKSRNPEDWPFTDHTYDNLGIPRNTTIPANADPSHYDLGLCQQGGLANLLPDSVTLDSLCGAFKVPSLRNVALTAPYGHNGFFTQLRDMLKFYVTRDTNPENWYPRALDGGVDKYDDLPEQYWGNVNEQEVPYDKKPGDPPHLDDAEIDDLLAFLQTLTDR